MLTDRRRGTEELREEGRPACRRGKGDLTAATLRELIATEFENRNLQRAARIACASSTASAQNERRQAGPDGPNSPVL